LLKARGKVAQTRLDTFFGSVNVKKVIDGKTMCPMTRVQSSRTDREKLPASSTPNSVPSKHARGREKRKLEDHQQAPVALDNKKVKAGEDDNEAVSRCGGQ
jgi:hypothetical protein